MNPMKHMTEEQITNAQASVEQEHGTFHIDPRASHTPATAEEALKAKITDSEEVKKYVEQCEKVTVDPVKARALVEQRKQAKWVEDTMENLRINPSLTDPWDVHGLLMHISDQRMPGKIQITSETLLYFALQAEELAETGQAIHNGIIHGTVPKGFPITEAARFATAAKQILELAQIIEDRSKQLKKLLAQEIMGNAPTPCRVLLTKEDAKELMDGAVDVAVVNAGFMLSSGIPAHTAYAATALSNLSKANPETGMIDKEPNGKWIKGPNFQLPDFDSIIENHLATE